VTSTRPGPWRVLRGGIIQRERTVSFRYNDTSYTGLAGDTLASALLANGVRVVARSFKFHRPRGVFSCGAEEPNGLLQIGSGARAIPSARAPLVELTSGLEARSQSGWPSVNFDLGRVMDVIAPLWAAGFYNKTFIWPRWHTYESGIRRMAGLGRAPAEPDPDRYELGNLHCDVLIVGGGAAGLQAAAEAAGAGERVVLVEQDPELGGELAWSGATLDGTAGQSWVAQTVRQLTQNRKIRLLTRTTAVGYYDHDIVALTERVVGAGPNSPRERYWIVRARKVVLATGVIEQPLLFANNDRPGVMLASAVRQYLHRYGVAIGSRVLVATNNDSVYPLIKELRNAGIEVVGVVDSRPDLPAGALSDMTSLGVRSFPGSIPVNTSGSGGLRSVTIGSLTREGSRIPLDTTIPCDALAVSGGFNPTLHLYSHAGGKLAYDESTGALLPERKIPAVQIVGAAAGKIAAGPRISPVGSSQRKWVDLLHDVTVSDLELALRENYTSVEHVKRFTTVGMAADQGKTSAAPSLGVLSQLRGIAAREMGHTTLRPPFMPITLGTIAGREIGTQFAPYRQLPMHDWHISHGAILHDFGEWKRPVAYVRPGETRAQAAQREGLAVRNSVGLLDGSSLGKIEIHGPDAHEFLNHFYVNDLANLTPWKARYGLMLRESGIIFDDGTVVMQAPDRFVLTTTSGNAGRVVQWLDEWHQCEWPQMRLAILPVTDAWATVSLAGPKAREVLSQLPGSVDLSPTAFPHLSMREGELLEMRARIYRVSFTGELTYEINVPTSGAAALWTALIEAGTRFDLQPLGLDALMQLRLEKGFLHIGADTDGTTVPADVGWGKVATNKKRDFIGRRSLTLPENLRPDRLQLVGLAGQAGAAFEIGSHLRVDGTRQGTDGWITSAGLSVLQGEPVALAMLRGGRARLGSEVDVYDSGVPVTRAKVVNPPFYDPTGERMNG
jgi:sarcosine oxidase subunit alpha